MSTETEVGYVVYATYEGGFLEATLATRADYDRWKKNGCIDWWGDNDPAHPDAEPYRRYPTFICFTKIVDDHDFVIGGSRGERRVYGREHPLPDPPATPAPRDIVWGSRS